MEELISIIVPAYNTEEYIRMCLDSILKQTYRDLEIIVIDDGSTDGTGRICDEYAEKDARIVVIHQPNQGLVRSRKTGLELAKGRYVGFVDSDDWIDEGLYEHLYRNLRETGAQVVTSGFIAEYADGASSDVPGSIPAGVYHPKSDPYFCKNMIHNERIEERGVSPFFWNKLYERDFLIFFEQRVDDQITYGEDDACIYPCMAFADTICVTNNCLCHYRLRPTSMSKTSDEKYFIRVNLLYLTMKYSFEAHPFAQDLIPQLDSHMAWYVLRGLSDLWGIRSRVTAPHVHFDCPVQEIKQNTVLYGAGEIGRCYYQQLMALDLHKNILWVDQNFRKLQEQGLPVKDVNELRTYAYSAIIVAVQAEGLYQEIMDALLEMGIDKNKIFWARPHPFF